MSHFASAGEASKNTTDLLLKLSTDILLSEDLDTFLQNTLAEVGNKLKVHRVYIFTHENHHWTNIFSWVDPELPPFTDLLEKGNLEKVLYEDGMFASLNSGKPYCVRSIDDFDDENARNALRSQYIKGLILVPLFSNEELYAFLGVDQCDDVENWVENTLDTMVAIGYLINNAIHYFGSLDFLHKKEKEAQELLDLLPVPVYITNPNTHGFLCYNKALGDYVGIENIENRKCYEVIHGFNAPCSFCKTDFLAIHSGSCEWEMYSEKCKVQFKIFDKCIQWDDIENARLTIALDINDSLRMQREQVLEREAFVAKSRFLANMSHELRTPLNGIIGMTQLAIQHNHDEKVGNYLEKVQDSSKTLLNVINDILDFSKIEAGKLTLEELPFDVREVCENIKEHFWEEASHKNIQLAFTIDDNVTPWLVGDSLRFYQIIQHLVENAVKFTEQGFVRYSLHVHEPKNEDGILLLRLVVEDSGIGITEEALQKMFVWFTQADSSSTRRYGGIGMGLAIVEKLLELMRGSIAVASTLGQGAAFTCLIPFVVAEQGMVCDSEPKNMDITGTAVLLAEDNEINSMIATEMLTAMGCTVEWVQDGLEVLACLEKKTYDVILMDVQMPRMDGLEATRRIRENSHFDNMPIIALTAHSEKEEINECYAAGMQAHALKPLSDKKLQKVIAEYTTAAFRFAR